MNNLVQRIKMTLWRWGYPPSRRRRLGQSYWWAAVRATDRDIQSVSASRRAFRLTLHMLDCTGSLCGLRGEHFLPPRSTELGVLGGISSRKI